MNILFLTSAAPVRSPIPTTEKRPPLGVGFLMAVLKQRGHKVFFSDEYLAPTGILETDFLVRQRIDFVGIYSNTICYTSTLLMFETLQRKRERGEWNGKIMVGGPHTAFGHERIPEYVDHVVIGEGEVTVPKIVEGEEIARVVRGEFTKNLDTLPRPAWEEFIYLPYMWHDRRIDGAPLYTFNTSRGCPYECAFCSVQGVWGRNYRHMSAERVVDDIAWMQKLYGLRAAYFREDHFTLHRARTEAFCELLLARDMVIPWMCESRVDSIDDPELVALMARAGCRTLYIGVESGSPGMLERLKKRESVEQFVRVFSFLKQHGIRAHASFVVGVPGETAEDRRLTEEFIRVTQPDSVRKNVYIGLPGSELYDELKESGLYEYEDAGGILYPRGYHDMVRQYSGGGVESLVYDPVTLKPEISFTTFMKYRGIEWAREFEHSPADEELLARRFAMQKQEGLLEAYLELVLRQVWQLDGGTRRVALYSAGTHTQLLLDLIHRLSLAMPLVVFDRCPERAMVKDVEVVHIDRLSEFDLTDILISNDRDHYEIFLQLLENPHVQGPPAVRVIDPYLYLPHAPYR